MESNKFVNDISGLSRTINSWENAELLTSTNKLIWDKTNNRFIALNKAIYKLFKASTIVRNSLIHDHFIDDYIPIEKNKTVNIKNFLNNDNDVSLEIACFADEAKTKLEEIIIALENGYVSEHDFPKFVKEIVRFSQVFCTFQLGIEKIIGNQITKKPSDGLFNILNNKLNLIAKLIASNSKTYYFSYDSYEIVKFCASRAPDETVENLEKISFYNGAEIEDLFKIFQHQNHRFQLAKLCVTKYSYYNSKIFGISDTDQIFELVKHYIKNIDTTKIIKTFKESINHLGITKKSHIFELIKLLAATKPYELAMEIQNLGIECRKDRIELFKICLKVDENENCIYLIDKFNILDQNNSFELAKLCAIKSGPITSHNIEKFQIKNQNELKEIFLKCTEDQVHAWRSISYIKNFHFTDKNMLLELAYLCASKDGFSTAGCIEDFSITESNHLLEIFKLCVKDYPGSIMKIKDFAFNDENILTELFRWCAGINLHSTIPYFYLFEIKNSATRFELAKFCSSLNGDCTASSIQNFDIADQTKLLEIAEICICSYIEKSKEHDNIKIMKILNNCFADEFINFDFEIGRKFLKLYSNKMFLKNPFIKIIDKIFTIENEVVKFKNIQWVATTMMFFGAMKSIKKIDDNHIDTLAKLGFFESVADLENPLLRLSISFILADLITIDNVPNEFNNILSKSHTVKIKKSWQRLSCLISAGLVSQGVASDIFIKDGLFRSETEKPSSCFFDKEKSFLLLHMLVLLYESKDLSPKEKENLLNRVINVNSENKNISTSQVSIDLNMLKEDKLDKNELKNSQFKILENIQAIISINDFMEINLLKENNNKSLLEMSEDILQTKLHCENIPNFAKKYYETFMQSRNPSSIVTYASKIHSLKEKNAEESLRNYIAFTLDDTFVENRYKSENNPHLQKIIEFNPILFETWKSNLGPILLDELKFKENFDPQTVQTAKDWMKEKLITDKHLDMDTLELKYLNFYLRESTIEKSNDIEKKLLEAKIVSLNNLKQINMSKESKLILNLKNCNDQIKSIDSKILEDSMKTNLDHLIEQKKNHRLKFDKDLNQLKILFPILNHLIIGAESNDDIYNIIESCKEIQAHTFKAKETLSKLNLEVLCIQWVKGTEILQSSGTNLDYNQIKSSKDKLKKCLLEIQEIMTASPFNSPEFANDIQSKINERSLNMAIGNAIVMETDDPIDILLCGTEVANSCQNVNADISTNKGLLGYLMDGKSKVLVIKNDKDSHSKILARCLLRLLWDDEEKKPVLYMDKLYPSKISEKHIQALEFIAKKKANLLNLPLLSKHGTGKPYNSVKSLGSSAPWEYSDNAGGITNGTYTLKGVKEFLENDHHPREKLENAGHFF